MGYLVTIYHSQANKGKNAEFRCQQFIGFRVYAPFFYQQFIKGGNKVREQFQERLIKLIIEFIPLGLAFRLLGRIGCGGVGISFPLLLGR